MTGEDFLEKVSGRTGSKPISCPSTLLRDGLRSLELVWASLRRILSESSEKGSSMLFHQTLPKMPTSKAPPAFYRLRDVIRITSLSRSTIYRRVAEGRFPSPIHLSGRASGWPSSALQHWIDDPEGYRAGTNPT